MILFEITHDYTEEGDGMKGYRYGSPTKDQADNPLEYRFKLLDDDGIVYYRGRCVEDAFEDLMDWGSWYAGATEVWGRKGNNKYEMIIG